MEIALFCCTGTSQIQFCRLHRALMKSNFHVFFLIFGFVTNPWESLCLTLALHMYFKKVNTKPFRHISFMEISESHKLKMLQCR